ncbi:hypothetical protein ETE46_06615 [Escherichia coli]|uniref:hypothetical protein n=1 Tax=Escherichia coli TaxID=562 RepID=UPI0010093D95|nr:hypothetical protein [Escherichia coli]QAU95482.1 hypothetical protein ETE46_06615 [Escherichia coli]
MTKNTRFSPEVRQRAVRMVLESQSEYDSQWAWYNNRRLLERLGHTPPAEAEKAYYASIGNDDLAA